MRFFIRLLLLVVVGLVVAVLVNTLRLPNHQLAAVPAAPAVAVNADTALGHLVGALRLATVSRTTYADTDTVPFDQLHAYLERTFPLVHQRLNARPLITMACSMSGPAPTPP